MNHARICRKSIFRKVTYVSATLEKWPFRPFGRAKTALALAPEGVGGKNGKMGKAKRYRFCSFLIVFGRFWSGMGWI
jgi:hypothetical protein